MLGRAAGDEKTSRVVMRWETIGGRRGWLNPFFRKRGHAMARLGDSERRGRHG